MITIIESYEAVDDLREYWGLILANRKVEAVFERMLFEHYGLKGLRRMV